MLQLENNFLYCTSFLQCIVEYYRFSFHRKLTGKFIFLTYCTNIAFDNIHCSEVILNRWLIKLFKHILVIIYNSNANITLQLLFDRQILNKRMSVNNYYLLFGFYDVNKI